MAQPSRVPVAAALGLLGRGAMLLGGVSLAVRLGLPAAAVPAAGYDGAPPQDDLVSGRGKPAEPPSRSARGAKHETDDMDGALMARLFMLLGTVAVCAVLGMVGLRYWVRSALLASQPAYTAEQRAVQEPPLPHLQAGPVGELAQLNRAAEALLSGYAWRDPGHSRARIPIGRAMALTVGRTLGPAP